MSCVRIVLPWKLGLPVKWILCSSRPLYASTECFMPWLLGKGANSFFNFFLLTTKDTKMLEVIDRMKEHIRTISVTVEGFFVSDDFLSGLRYIWLNMVRNTINRMDEETAIAAIHIKLSGPYAAYLEHLLSKLTVRTWENSVSSSLTVPLECASRVTNTSRFKCNWSIFWSRSSGQTGVSKHKSWHFLTAYISFTLEGNLVLPLFWVEAISCNMLRNGVIPIPPAIRSILSYLQMVIVLLFFHFYYYWAIKWIV